MATILFICKENRYRSQIAEALFNHMTTKHHAISAAGAEPAINVSVDAISLVKKIYDIDMSAQVPKKVTVPMLEKANKIITLCDPKDCILIPRHYIVEHWDIPNMENLSEADKLKEIKNLHDKIADLITSLD